ncbi:DUF1330 domain-containing protein [Mumia zhuanghuii]|nr:DUF1330 domain-containing protein [Mumia zhuanghuii]
MPKSYAVALLTDVDLGPAIEEYLERIDQTLEPFGGRFLVHGAAPVEREGVWPGQLILIEFDDPRGAEQWYASEAYQAIVPLRANNSAGAIALFDGVTHPHRATDVLSAGDASRA